MSKIALCRKIHTSRNDVTSWYVIVLQVPSEVLTECAV